MKNPIKWLKDRKKAKPLFDKVRLFLLEQYDGVCHGCGAQVHFANLIATKVCENKESILFWPVHPYFCDNCHGVLGGIQIFNNLNVTNEFKEIANHDQNQ